MRRESKTLTEIDVEHILNSQTAKIYIHDINELIQLCHSTAVNKGWHPDPNTPSFGEQNALIHPEVSEALQAYRDNGFDIWRETIHNEGIKSHGVPYELADILIRVFDTAGKHNIDLGAALIEKMRYNLTREHRHGGKAL